jgi:DNA-binding transcriptional regulator GbsR (MarR family)
MRGFSVIFCYYFAYEEFFSQFADMAQQAFSRDIGSTLHLTIPALEMLHKAWSSCGVRVKYLCFAPMLKAAAKNLDEYYENTTDSPAYIMSMSKLLLFITDATNV